MDVFVVMARSGEYEQRYEWIVGVYSTMELAEAAMARRSTNAKAYQTAWDEWCKIGGSKSGVPHPECLTPGECTGDSFAILQVPLNVTADRSPDYRIPGQGQ